MAHVAIKIRIGLKPNGHAGYPDFNRIDAALRDDMDWSRYVDKHGGWHYDQVAGHQDDDPAASSPIGVQFGMLVVPETFADSAVAMFPTDVAILNDADAGTFYNSRAHIRDAAIRENLEILQGIKAKRDLSIAEDQQDRDALDPDHPAAGRRRNTVKTWSDFKTQRGITMRA